VHRGVLFIMATPSRTSSSRADRPRLRSRLTAALLVALATTAWVHGVLTVAASERAEQAAGFTVPPWLFTLPSPPSPEVWDSVTLHRIPKSRATYTEQRMHNGFNAADWDSASHPPMPDIVRYGRKPTFMGCGYCHMPDGNGRPENANIAGLSATYMTRQLADMKARTRRSAWHEPYAPTDNMQRAAENASDAEVALAAEYFAGLRPRKRMRVVEAERIPRVLPVRGLYRLDSVRGTEPLGQRLLEVTPNFERHELRDPFQISTTYAPIGSLKRGRSLVQTPVTPGALTCTGCHGPTLHGIADIPPLAGRGATYLLRQLIAFKTGDRNTSAGAPMRVIAGAMTLDDMIAVAAYAASLNLEKPPSARSRNH
jgi:cytochrome c553